MSAAPQRVPLPRWVTPLLTAAAVVLLPWTLWLTFSLPSRYVTHHYDLAWVGFDIALAAAFAGTAWAALRSPLRLVPLAAVTGTMLVCDAWFDVVTSIGGGEIGEAALEAAFVELPLAAVCLVHRRRRGVVPRGDGSPLRRRLRADAPPQLSQLEGFGGIRLVAGLLEQTQPMLELRDAELELVEVVASDETELVGKGAKRTQRLTRQPRPAAAHTPRKLCDELLERVEDPLATAGAHAASSGDARGASRAAPGRPAPTVLR